MLYEKCSWCVFVCACVSTSTCVGCAHVCVCVEVRRQPQMSLGISSHPFLRWGLSLARQARQKAPRNLPISASHLFITEITSVHHPDFHIGPKDPDSGPHVCEASALLTELSSHPNHSTIKLSMQQYIWLQVIWRGLCGAFNIQFLQAQGSYWRCHLMPRSFLLHSSYCFSWLPHGCKTAAVATSFPRAGSILSWPQLSPSGWQRFHRPFSSREVALFITNAQRCHRAAPVLKFQEVGDSADWVWCQSRGA